MIQKSIPFKTSERSAVFVDITSDNKRAMKYSLDLCLKLNRDKKYYNILMKKAINSEKIYSNDS